MSSANAVDLRMMKPRGHQAGRSVPLLRSGSAPDISGIIRILGNYDHENKTDGLGVSGISTHGDKRHRSSVKYEGVHYAGGRD